MRNRLLGISLLVVLLAALVACGASGGSAGKPTIVIQSPASDSQFHEGEVISVQSVATDKTGIVSIDLTVDGVTARTDKPETQGGGMFTLSQDWKATAGTHVIGVRAFNASGTASDLATVTLTVASGVARISTPTLAAPVPTSIAAATRAPTAPGATSIPSASGSIAGDWDSDFGRVTLEMGQANGNLPIPVTGFWVTTDGNKGTIKSGTFDPQSGVLEISYYQPWNSMDGTARFTLAPDGKTLKGTWQQPNGQGDWIMQRSSAITASSPVAGATRAPTVAAAISNPTSTPVGGGGRIAFASKRDGNYEIYVMNADGSGQTRLTNDPKTDTEPAISPDGTRVAFYSKRDGNWEIYVVNADGSGLTRLTNNTATDAASAWSPDGTRLCFYSDRDGKYYQIYVMNADGSGQTRLTNNAANDEDCAWSPDGKRIAFISDRDGKFGIYVMNADGSGQTRLTNNTADEDYPVFSPDGTRIAFQSNRDGNMEIYVMNADGSGQTRLTNNTVVDERPTWSSDGTRIAFDSNPGDKYDLYVMNADGSQQTRLTTSGDNQFPTWQLGKSRSVAVSNPTTAPIGGGNGRIALVAERDGNREIYTMNPDGSQQTRLTNNSADDGAPAWSPDGARLAFASNRDANWEIYVMNADGSAQTRLTNNSKSDSWPAWSPDGKRIAFQSDRDGSNEIYVMNSDGSGQTRLTNNTANDQMPSWSPDGARIAFYTDRDGNWEIYGMNADGSGQTRITNNPASEQRPAWSPDGKQIVFPSKRDGNYEIYVMNADGSAQTRLTNTESAVEEFAAWSPDGKRICFDTDRDGKYEIYIMNADGSQQTRITNTQGDNWACAWQPATTAPGGVAQPTVAAPTSAPATATPAPPTRVPATATPAPPPGVYVIDMHTEPAEAKQKQNIAFHVTFFNNIGAQANMKWYVQVFEQDKPDKKQAFGETDKVDSQIPVGTSEFVSPANWKPGGGVPCKPFIARVYWVQPNGNTPYEKPGGGNFEYYFTVCP